MNEEDDKTKEFAVAGFGIEVEAFLNGQIGRFIFDRAEQHRMKAIEAFKVSTLTDDAEVRKLQNDIVVPDLVISWLSGAIQEGFAATLRLKEEEQNNY